MSKIKNQCFYQFLAVGVSFSRSHLAPNSPLIHGSDSRLHFSVAKHTRPSERPPPPLLRQTHFGPRTKASGLPTGSPAGKDRNGNAQAERFLHGSLFN